MPERRRTHPYPVLLLYLYVTYPSKMVTFSIASVFRLVAVYPCSPQPVFSISITPVRAWGRGDVVMYSTSEASKAKEILILHDFWHKSFNFAKQQSFLSSLSSLAKPTTACVWTNSKLYTKTMKCICDKVHLLALFLANFLTTLCSHLDVTCSYYIWFNLMMNGVYSYSCSFS